MTKDYRHTQHAGPEWWFTVAVLVALALGVEAWFNGVVLMAVAAILIALIAGPFIVVFSRLTVEVDDIALRAFFGRAGHTRPCPSPKLGLLKPFATTGGTASGSGGYHGAPCGLFGASMQSRSSSAPVAYSASAPTSPKRYSPHSKAASSRTELEQSRAAVTARYVPDLGAHVAGVVSSRSGDMGGW